MNNTGKLIIAIIIPLVIGFTSGFFTTTGPGSWYQALENQHGTHLVGYLLLFGPYYTL